MLQLNPLIVNASELDTYYPLLDIDKLNPYEYSGTIKEDLMALVERVGNLDEDYSTSEALNILKDLNGVVERITKDDYDRNYEILHDEANYETGEFRKLKYGEPDWIIRNIIHYMFVNSASDDEWKQMIDYVYSIGLLEMQNGCKYYFIMNNINDLIYIEKELSSSMQDYIDYVVIIADKDCINYDNGTTPTTKIPSEYQETFEAERNADSVTDVEQGVYEDDSNIVIVEFTPMDELDNIHSTDITMSTSNTNSSSVSKKDNISNMQKYISNMSSISNNSQVKVNSSELKDVYYTLNKNSDTIDWIDTGIAINDELDYSNFLTILSIVARNANYYYFEDDDMAMFIADGKNVVFNKVDAIPASELEELFDVFDKFGIKVMLKSDSNVDTSNSLETRIKNGEINTISINGSNLILTNPPILTKNILQLPLEETAKALGYEINVSGNTITLTYKNNIADVVDEDGDELTLNDDIVIILNVGSSNYTINGIKNSFKTNVTKDNGVIYCEFDKIAEKVNLSYYYNATSGIIEFN